MSEVIYEVADRVAWLTINRPEARNALDRATREGLRAGFERFRDDDEAAVLVLTGAGERAFCAGADLKEMAEEGTKVPPKDFLVHLERTLAVEKPIMAAVNGAAYAGGFWLAQQVDLVVAAEHATFAVTEAKVGRGSPWAAPLPWMVGPRVAMELLVCAEPLSARRMYEVGFVNRVVPGEELRAAAQAMALGIAANAPLSVRAGKALVLAAADHGFEDGLDEGDRIYAPVYLSDDAQEGPRAFREKRPPVWTGR